MTETNATARFTLIQRDEFGDAVNTITGLNEASANDLADVLGRGDAYQGDRPWTCEVMREPTPEEQITTVVDKWLTKGESLTRVDHMVACLRHVADQLETLSDVEVPRVGLKIEMHFFSSDGGDAERMIALDEVAAVFGRKGEMNESGCYHTGHLYGGGLRMVTITEPAKESKPLIISDSTIREAEQISRMVPATDLHLPQAKCGCPIKTRRSDGGTFVDHCEACIVSCDGCGPNGQCIAHRDGASS